MCRSLILITIALFLLFACEKSPNERLFYELADKETVPEGIAFSEKTQKYYLTSVAKSKIVEVDKTTGAQKDFITQFQYGYMPGVGIFVDDHKEILYAIGGYFFIKDSLSSLFAFDLRSKKLLNRYHVKDQGEHFLNDLIQDKNGNFYLTDSKGSAIYHLNVEKDSLYNFFESEEIQYPNGIAISDNNSKLYIASFNKGVRILDLKTKKVINKIDSSGNTNGIDGLEFYNGNLYGVQNGVQENGDNFRKLVLNKDQSDIIDIKVIDNDPKKLKVPLTFSIDNEKAVVIGNSNLEYLNQVNLTFPQKDSLRPTKLYIYDLD